MTIDREFIRNIREKNVSQQELADYLVRNNAIYDIAMKLAEYMLKDTPQVKITLSDEEYQAVMNLFRRRGFKDDGSPELRGGGGRRISRRADG